MSFGIESIFIFSLSFTLISITSDSDPSPIILVQFVFLLSSFTFFFYKKLSWRIIILGIFFSGLITWIIGRNSYHIGASGMIYSLAAFLFVSGLIRKNPRLAALSMIIIFLYGSLIWGVFPLKSGVSWEGHLSGLFAGVITAIFYKDEGPKQKKYQCCYGKSKTNG